METSNEHTLTVYTIHNMNLGIMFTAPSPYCIPRNEMYDYNH